MKTKLIVFLAAGACFAGSKAPIGNFGSLFFQDSETSVSSSAFLAALPRTRALRFFQVPM